MEQSHSEHGGPTGRHRKPDALSQVPIHTELDDETSQDGLFSADETGVTEQWNQAELEEKARQEAEAERLKQEALAKEVAEREERQRARGERRSKAHEVEEAAEQRRLEEANLGLDGNPLPEQGRRETLSRVAAIAEEFPDDPAKQLGSMMLEGIRLPSKISRNPEAFHQFVEDAQSQTRRIVEKEAALRNEDDNFKANMPHIASGATVARLLMDRMNPDPDQVSQYVLPEDTERAKNLLELASAGDGRNARRAQAELGQLVNRRQSTPRQELLEKLDSWKEQLEHVAAKQRRDGEILLNLIRNNPNQDPREILEGSKLIQKENIDKALEDIGRASTGDPETTAVLMDELGKMVAEGKKALAESLRPAEPPEKADEKHEVVVPLKPSGVPAPTDTATSTDTTDVLGDAEAIDTAESDKANAKKRLFDFFENPDVFYLGSLDIGLSNVTVAEYRGVLKKLLKRELITYSHDAPERSRIQSLFKDLESLSYDDIEELATSLLDKRSRLARKSPPATTPPDSSSLPFTLGSSDRGLYRDDASAVDPWRGRVTYIPTTPTRLDPFGGLPGISHDDGSDSFAPPRSPRTLDSRPLWRPAGGIERPRGDTVTAPESSPDMTGRLQTLREKLKNRGAASALAVAALSVATVGIWLEHKLGAGAGGGALAEQAKTFLENKAQSFRGGGSDHPFTPEAYTQAKDAFFVQKGEGGEALMQHMGKTPGDWLRIQGDLGRKFPGSFYRMKDGNMGIRRPGELPNGVVSYLKQILKIG